MRPSSSTSTGPDVEGPPALPAAPAGPAAPEPPGAPDPPEPLSSAVQPSATEAHRTASVGTRLNLGNALFIVVSGERRGRTGRGTPCTHWFSGDPSPNCPTNAWHGGSRLLFPGTRRIFPAIFL